MFEGLEEIDWASMRHAYGSAAKVPELLRGLASDDPAVQETALDGMYAAVHHQGDIYECTVASIPYLLDVATEPGLPGRNGVIRLLGNIAGVHGDETCDVGGVADPDDADSVPAVLRQMARRAVAAACPEFLSLLADADPQVRSAVPTVLLTCDNDGERVFSALQNRMRLEPDAAVRSAIISAVGRLGRRAAVRRAAEVDATAVRAWLTEQAEAEAEPRLRLAAMSELAAWVPPALPTGIGPTVAGLLRAVYASGTPPEPPAGFSTNTLIGGLREFRDHEASGRRAADAANLVHGISAAFGDRVDDREELLAALLREPGWEPRIDAIRPARLLIGEWRGVFADLVFLIGQQLLDPNPRLCDRAAYAVENLDELAAPAADALVRSLDDAPRSAPRPDRPVFGLPPWLLTSEREPPTISPVMRALAALRDARVLPVVRFALEFPDVPRFGGWLAAQFGADPQAADLVPLLRRRLRDLAEAGDEHGRIHGLCNALGQFGDTAAVPELLALVHQKEEAEVAAGALGQIGPGAADAVPALHGLLGCGKPRTEVAAASALWRIDGDAGPVLPVLARYLDDDRYDVEAANALAALGPAAAATAPVLREKMHRTDRNVWRQPYAARALWRATGDTDAVVPVLCAVWAARPHTRSRTHLARTAAEMGHAAAALSAHLREELGERRRHENREGRWSSASIADDLDLQRACAEALTAIAD